MRSPCFFLIRWLFFTPISMPYLRRNRTGMRPLPMVASSSQSCSMARSVAGSSFGGFSCSMYCCELITATHIAVCAKGLPLLYRGVGDVALQPQLFGFFDSQSSSNSRLPRSQSRFAIRSSFFSISLLRQPRRKHSPSISLVCFFSPLLNRGIYHTLRLSVRASWRL